MNDQARTDFGDIRSLVDHSSPQAPSVAQLWAAADTLSRMNEGDRARARDYIKHFWGTTPTVHSLRMRGVLLHEERMRGELEGALERLYDVFNQCPLRQGLPPFGYSMSAERVRELWEPMRTTPLRELTGEQIWKFASGATLTWGGAEDIRHFLPRLIELMWSDRVSGLLGAFFYRLPPNAAYATWPEVEQEALEQWVRSALVYHLTTYSWLELPRPRSWPGLVADDRLRDLIQAVTSLQRKSRTLQLLFVPRGL